jgi:hypothetical protein
MHTNGLGRRLPWKHKVPIATEGDQFTSGGALGAHTTATNFASDLTAVI